MKNSNPVDSLPVFFFLTFFITDAFILYLICIYYIHTIVDIIVPRVRQIYSPHWTNMFGEAVCLCVACCQADNAELCLYLCEKKYCDAVQVSLSLRLQSASLLSGSPSDIAWLAYALTSQSYECVLYLCGTNIFSVVYICKCMFFLSACIENNRNH